MKQKLYFLLSLVLICLSLGNPLHSQTLIAPADELIFPQNAITGNSTPGRLQYVCRLRLTGLTPNATYRYTTGASTSATITTATAPGNFFGIGNTPAGTAGYIVGYTSSKSMSGTVLGASPNENEFTGASRYHQFVTDASGNYTGWFCVVPTSNAVFAPGNNMYFYIQLNNGAGGTSIAGSYRTTSTIHVVDYGTTASNANQCTAVKGSSNVAGENMIFIYDNTAGTGRPLYGTWVESDGISSSFSTWYNQVEPTPGMWGAVIPNALPNGIQRIEARDVSTGTILGCPALDADGVWPGGANTVNPAGGTTPLVITVTDAPLQFIASSNSPVCPGSTIILSSTTGTSYNWSGPSSFSSSSASPFITNASAANAGVYTVQITDANGCTSPANTTVAVSSTLSANVTGGGTICPGDSTLITFTFSGPGPWDFTYSNGSTSTSITGLAVSPYTFYAHTAGVYTISTVTSNGCTGTGTGSATVNTNITTPPTISPSAPTIYMYNSVTLTASGPGTIKWYTVPTNGLPIFTGTTYTTPGLTATTTYYVEAVVSGCPSTRTAVTVTVTPNPVTMNVYNYWTPFALGTYENMTIKFGGFSGLHSVPGNGTEFYTVTDRGPNLDANNNVHALSNPNAKLFPLPGFSPSIVHFRTQGDSIVIMDIKPIKRPNNTNTSGLINPVGAGGTGELAFIDTSGAVATPDIWGIDSEGITAGNDDDFWMCEEYGTSVWHVDSTGRVINRYTPWANSVSQPQDLQLDTAFRYRNPNKGLEGLAYAPNGKVYAAIQNMVFFPASAASAIKSNSRLHRIEEIDPATGVTRMFGYEHDPVPSSPNYGSTINNGNRYIGDAVAVNDHQFLVLEHGKSSTETYAKVYLVDIAAATPITQATYSGLTFEQMYTAANAQSHGITCVTKTLLIDLISCGYDGNLDKEEGLALVNDSTIAIANDNDFGVISPNADGNIAANGVPTRVYVFHLTTHLDLCRNAHITVNAATTFCQGDSLSLQANIAPGLTYQWNLNGSPIAGATANHYTANAAGNYSVSTMNTTGCLANSNVKTISVLPAPPATATAAGPVTFCAGNSVTLSANTGTGLTYQWQLNNSNISGETNPNYTANASGNYNVIVTGANGCSAASAISTVVVNPLPAATASANGPTTFCTGNSVTLAANSGTGLSYQWQLNAANIAGATNQNYVAASPGNYDVVVSDANGCSATSTVTNIVVNPLPSSSVLANGPLTFCAGGTVVLNGPTGNGLNYQWTNNSTNISGATNSSYTANTSGNFALLVTDANGCSAASSPVAVTVNAAPLATASAGSAITFCQGDSVLLTANSGTGLTYQWMNNNSTISNATAIGLMVNASGSYNVIVSNASSCSDTSSAIVVTVNPLPAVPVITQAGNTLSAPVGYTYQWYLNGNPIAGATQQTYVASTSGNYSVEISDGNSCSSVSAPYAFTPTNITALTVNTPDATVYPNPFSNSTQLEILLPADMNVSIEVYNTLGEKTAVVPAEKMKAGKNTIELNRTLFGASGIYFLQVSCGSSTISKKVIVE